MGEEGVSKLTGECGKVNTSLVRGDTHAVETTESSKSGLTKDQIFAMGLEAQEKARKEFEELNPRGTKR